MQRMSEHSQEICGSSPHIMFRNKQLNILILFAQTFELFSIQTVRETRHDDIIHEKGAPF